MPPQWLVYWYVCGTDIETAHIAFKLGTNLMSDDPNAIILAEPERHPGCATRSIKEVEESSLSPNVKIFMQAGGTYVWGHKNFRDNNAKINTKAVFALVDENGNPVKDENGRHKLVAGDVLGNGSVALDRWFLSGNINHAVVSNGKIGRYVYDQSHRNWHPREQLPISGEKDTETDMGSQAGLVSFLEAGQELERSLYPDGNVRRVLIFVDHGVTYEGGLYGICKDAYTGNSLSLKEIHDAFDEVKSGWTNPDKKPFEVVAFEACNMSAYETDNRIPRL